MAVRPCWMALSDERRLPSSVRGPVECWAFWRLMVARKTETVALGLMAGCMMAPWRMDSMDFCYVTARVAEVVDGEAFSGLGVL